MVWSLGQKSAHQARGILGTITNKKCLNPASRRFTVNSVSQF